MRLQRESYCALLQQAITNTCNTSLAPFLFFDVFPPASEGSTNPRVLWDLLKPWVRRAPNEKRLEAAKRILDFLTRPDTTGLCLSGCQLSALPSAVFQLPHFKRLLHLDLSDNQFTYFRSVKPTQTYL